MNAIFSRTLFLTVITATLYLIPQSGNADIVYDVNDRAIFIPGLEIAGIGQFDVAFEYEISLDDKYGTGDPPSLILPYFWGDSSGADAATLAIAAALNADGPVLPAVVSNNIAVPVEENTSGGFEGSSAVIFPGVTSPSWTGGGAISGPRTVFPPNLGWATFTPVPEPGSFAMFALASGFLMRRRRVL